MTTPRRLLTPLLLVSLATPACDNGAQPRSAPLTAPEPEHAPTPDPTRALLRGASLGAAIPIGTSPTWLAQIQSLPLQPWFDAPTYAIALDAFEDRDYPQAASAFRAIAALDRHPDRRSAARYMAALAHTFDDVDDTATLEALYRDEPLLQSYYAYFASQAHFEARRYADAVAWSARVPMDDPNGPRALLTRVRALVRLGRHDEALDLLRQHPLHDPELTDAHIGLLRDAGLERPATLLDALLVLGWTDSRPAQRRIDALLPDASEHREAARLLRSGERLYRRHQYRRAVRALRKAARALPEGSPQRCEALLLLARSFERRDRAGDADDTYRAADAECALTPSHPLILFSAGRFLADSGQHERALACFERLYTHHPDASVCDDARLVEAELHANAGQTALAHTALLAAAESGDDQRERAAFDLFWNAWSRGELERALRHAALARDIEPSDEDTLARAHYWYARTLQELGREDEAMRAYDAALAHAPLSYYGALAYARLHEALGESAALERRQNVLAQASPLPTALTAKTRLEPAWLAATAALLRLGLDSATERHIAHRLPEHDVDWLLAALYDQSGQLWRSYRHARRNQRELYLHPPSPSTLPLWSLAFPTPFGDAVERGRAGLDVPTAFIYAVMRRESSFRERARSSAGARGLMQLMLPTAQAMYEQDEHDGALSFEDLTERPELNVRLGALYLHRQLSRYGHPALAAAAYNAGGPSVRRWLGERGDLDLDHFVETIPYDQTRRYTRAVLAYYSAYHTLETGEPLLLSLSFK